MVLIQRTSILLALSLLVAPANGQESKALPEGPGVNLVYAKCQQCHPISYVVDSAGLPDFLWQDTLSLMKQLGMKVTDEEEQKLYEYFITYLGINPPPKPSEGDTRATTPNVDGATVYASACTVCHGPDGKGTSEAFPPVAGHAAELAAADRSYLPLVVLYGLSGEIDVNGKSFNGVMPPWSHLSNEAIAAVLNLITGWNPSNVSKPEPFTASEIEASRGLGLTGPQVRERRP